MATQSMPVKSSQCISGHLHNHEEKKSILGHNWKKHNSAFICFIEKDHTHSIVCITTELQMFKERMKGNAIEKEREKKEKERKRERIST